MYVQHHDSSDHHGTVTHIAIIISISPLLISFYKQGPYRSFVGHCVFFLNYTHVVEGRQ